MKKDNGPCQECGGAGKDMRDITKDYAVTCDRCKGSGHEPKKNPLKQLFKKRVGLKEKYPGEYEYIKTALTKIIRAEWVLEPAPTKEEIHELICWALGEIKGDI